MKLEEYMKASSITDQGFADRIGVNRLSVFKYRHGRVMPKRRTMEKIVGATNGQVTASDFYTSTDQPT